MRLFDAHIHLDLMADAALVARELGAAGVGALSCTVSPRDWEAALEAVRGTKGVHAALGAHPWWIADGRVGEEDVDRLCDLIPRTRLIGEVGLDFSPRHVPEGSERVQVEAFGRIVRGCVEASRRGAPRILSIHSVRAAGAVLDTLEREGAHEECRCVFHWFSGSSEELWRAIRMGCWFSLGERSVATRRGREYARLVPGDRLLTETDYPPEAGWGGTAADVAASLERAATGLADARGTEPAEVRELAVANARALLD